MGIIEFFVIVLVIGLAVYLINTYTPIPPQFKTVVLVAGIIVVVVVLLNALGIVGRDVQIPRLR